MTSVRSVPLPRLADVADRERVAHSDTAFGRGRRFSELVRIARKRGLLPFGRLDFGTAPEKSALRAQQAEGLRRALEEAGGAFVKMGQLLSTRDDLLPSEWVEALSHLQKNVAPAPWADVEALLESELGAPLDTAFATFDRIPVAAASIAQVHRATLANGSTVAVKVQRPGIEPVVKRDVAIALRIARILSHLSPQARRLGIEQIAEQYAADLVRQVDFRREAINLAALRSGQSRSARASELRLPELHDSLSTGRVLVMEYIEGETLSAVQASSTHPPDLGETMRAVVRSFVRQVVFDGVYHSDLHPGNIMLGTDGRPALIDFGSVGRLDLGLRQSIQDLTIAFLQGDTQRIGDGVLSMSPLPDGADEDAFRRELTTFVTYELGPGARIGVDTVDAAVDIFTSFGISIPPDFVAAARAFAILEGTLRTLVPDFDLLEEARSLARQQIGDQLTPGNIRDVFNTEALSLLPGLRRLPRRVDRIADALETGNLNVNVRLLADRRDRRLLMGLVGQTLLVIVGAAAGVMALVYFAKAPVASASISTTTVGWILATASAVLLLTAMVDAAITRRRG